MAAIRIKFEIKTYELGVTEKVLEKSNIYKMSF